MSRFKHDPNTEHSLTLRQIFKLYDSQERFELARPKARPYELDPQEGAAYHVELRGRYLAEDLPIPTAINHEITPQEAQRLADVLERKLEQLRAGPAPGP